uniref:GLPGLI family protein n=1 Tax=Fulvivirga sp. TaxID=1931237 RepID=UPI00404AC2A5
MNSIYHKLIILSCIFVYCTICNGQSTTEVVYSFKMAEDIQEYEAKLYLQDGKSEYVYKQTENSSSLIKKGIEAQTIYSDSVGYRIYRDLRTNTQIERYFCKESTPYLIIDNLKPDWQITNKTKVIEGYKCIQATAEFRGRQYTAWYSADIPVPSGPWKFHGLPGLIMEVADKKLEVYFKIKSLGAKTDIDISMPAINNETSTYTDLMDCRIEAWKQKNEQLKARAEMIMATSNIEIELEIPERPNFTELEK